MKDVEVVELSQLGNAFAAVVAAAGCTAVVGAEQYVVVDQGVADEGLCVVGKQLAVLMEEESAELECIVVDECIAEQERLEGPQDRVVRSRSPSQMRLHREQTRLRWSN